MNIAVTSGNIQPKLMTSEAIQSLGVGKGIADTIMIECGKAPDINHCVKAVLGVANSESGLFSACALTKNCHGVMQWVNGHRSLKRFTTYEEGVSDWIRRYIRNGWYTRVTANDWIDKGGYCNRNEGDGCKYRYSHYSEISEKIDQIFQ